MSILNGIKKKKEKKKLLQVRCHSLFSVLPWDSHRLIATRWYPDTHHTLWSVRLRDDTWSYLMEDVSWDVKKAPIFFFLPNNKFNNFLVKWSPAAAVKCSWTFTDTDKLFCGIFKQTKVFQLQTSVQTGFLQVSFHVSQTRKLEIIENLKGEVSCILTCCTWRCGRGGVDLLASYRSLGGWGKIKRKEKGELVGSYQNNSRFCFLPDPSQPLESVFFHCLRLSPQTLVLCKKSSRIWSSQRRQRLSLPWCHQQAPVCSPVVNNLIPNKHNKYRV